MKLARLFGHPIHQGLIVLPLGLFSGAVVFDLIFAGTHTLAYADASYWMVVGGIIGGLLAAVFGLWDLLHVPGGTRARQVGVVHGLVNVVVVVLFIVSWSLRQANAHVPSGAAIALGVIGLAISGLGGWLGGELVLRYGIGVHAGANPETLPEKPATAGRRTGTISPSHR